MIAWSFYDFKDNYDYDLIPLLLVVGVCNTVLGFPFFFNILVL